jgi:S-layer protein
MAVITPTIQNEVAELYLGFFGRAPDASGFGYWTQAIANGNFTPTQIANAFAVTPEFVGVYGGLTPAAQVTKAYNNVLNRAPDTAGLNYWVGELNAGQSIGSVVWQIVNAAYSQGTSTADGNLVLNKVAVGVYFATVLQSNNTTVAGTAFAQVTSNPASVATAEAALAQATANTYTLTTSQTVYQGANNQNNNFVGTIGANSPTFAPGQSINGGGTLNGTFSNTLTLNDTNASNTGTITASVPVGTTLTGIQNLTINSQEAVSVTTSAGGFSNVNSVTVNSQSGGQTTGTANSNADAISAGATQAITVNDTVAGNIAATYGLTVSGGSSVAITETNGAYTAAGTGIVVKGGTGTTTVSVVQTKTTGADQNVNIYDVNNSNATPSGTGALGVITNVTIDGLDGTATVYSSNLQNLTVNDVTTAGATVTVTEGTLASGVTASKTLALNLNNNKSFTLVDTSAKFTTLNVTTGAKASSVVVTDANLATLNVAGSSVLTLGANSATALAVSGAAGVKTTLNTGESFASTSTGTDSVTIGAAATAAIAGNKTAAEEITANFAATTTIIGTGGSVSGFNILGNAFAGNSLNVGSIGTFTGLDAEANTTFTNVTAGTALTIGTTGSTVVYTTADTAGATDAVSVTIGGSSNTSALTVAGLTLQDSQYHGIGSVTVVSNDSTAGAQQIITSLYDANLSSLTVNGNAGLEIQGTTTLASAALTITGNETGTSGILIDALSGSSSSALKTVTVAGSDAVALTSLTETGTSFTANDSATAAVGIATLVDSSATTETFTNTGTKDLTIGNTAHTGAAVATLNLNGAVIYRATADGVTSGITVTGGTDNDAVNLTLNGGTAASKTNSIILGNGNDYVHFTTVAGDSSATNNVQLGNGNNDVADTVVAELATQNLTVGNGNNIIDYSAETSTTESITITAGTGQNTIKVGATNASITVGSHVLADTFQVGNLSSVTTAYSAITGAAANDIVNFGVDIGNTVTVAAQTTTAASPQLLTSWITAAATAAGAAAGAGAGAGWFQFQGNTYIVEQNHAASIDTVVELVGTHTLTAAATATSGVVLHS